MSEYKRITPPDEVVQGDLRRLAEMQTSALGPNSIFIPTQFGILITPDSHQIFSVNQTALTGEVYDLPGSERVITNAETKHVFFCGALRANLGDYKILAHGAGPLQLARLTERALDLILESGEIPDEGHIGIFVNSKSPIPAHLSGSTGYTGLIIDVLSRRSLKFSHSQTNIGEMYNIGI